MKSKILLVAIAAALVLPLAFGAGTALAAEHEGPTSFFISAYHYVKGDEIGLTREAPVFVQVVRNGQVLAYLPMKYMDRVDANLPGGTYTLNFLDQGSFAKLFSCGPYDIPNGADIRLQAHEQGAGRVPTCYVK